MTPSDDRPRPARPRPARPERVDSGGRGRGDRDDPRPGVASRPTPVRDLSGTDGTEGEAPPSPSTTVEIEGVTWTVRVEGRGRTPAPASAPLILLGFFRSPDDERATREVLVSRQALDRLSEIQLEEAFARAAAPPDPGVRKELFPETSIKGRKGDG